MANPIDPEEAARRLARAIASDIQCYNEELIRDGIQNDNLFEVLKDQIEEHRTLYKNRVSPELVARNYFDRALIDIIVQYTGDIPSKMW